MSWLKKVVINAGAPKVSIIQALKSNMGGYQPARSIATVHASDITKSNFCPRHWALLDILKAQKKDEYISTALQATFDVGKATAKVLVEEWAGESAIGNWKCLRCDANKKMTTKPKKGCPGHGAKCLWEYEEPAFLSTQYGVSGSIDVLMELGVPLWMVTELKIIKVEDFENLVAPLPEHRIRTALYLKLIADSNDPAKNKINLHEARVLYVSRGYGKKNADHGDIMPFKEYTVQRDDTVLEKPLAKALQIKKFREDGLMPSGICNTALDKPAKSCNVCTQCFSGQFPTMQEPLI
jgi:hypothetical protein